MAYTISDSVQHSDPSIADPTIIEVVPNADVTFLVGPQGTIQHRIKACSALLVIASKYFSTLLGPRFREGQAAANGEDIELNDDDPEAFTTLCNILHLQHDALVYPMSSEDLLALAIVADKYGCTKSLSLTLNTIFPMKVDSSRTVHEVGRFVAASYLLDHPQLFRNFTRSLVIDFTPPFLDLMTADYGHLVPGYAWCRWPNSR